VRPRRKGNCQGGKGAQEGKNGRSTTTRKKWPPINGVRPETKRGEDDGETSTEETTEAGQIHTSMRAQGTRKRRCEEKRNKTKGKGDKERKRRQRGTARRPKPIDEVNKEFARWKREKKTNLVPEKKNRRQKRKPQSIQSGDKLGKQGNVRKKGGTTEKKRGGIKSLERQQNKKGKKITAGRSQGSPRRERTNDEEIRRSMKKTRHKGEGPTKSEEIGPKKREKENLMHGGAGDDLHTRRHEQA